MRSMISSSEGSGLSCDVFFVRCAMTIPCSVAQARSRQKASPCPGLFRIVPSKDGGICRIKLPFGQITWTQARAIAEAGAQWGNGQIELTNRGNFQIRGIQPAHEDLVIAALLAADLGPKDAGADDIRNVMVSPVMGLDPMALVDVAALARQILDLLENDPRHHVLSPKFSILLDGGEADGAVDHPHDIWLSAVNEGAFAFGFAGHPPLTAHDEPMVGIVAIDHVLPLVQAALDVFLDYAAADPQVKRFRDIARHPDLAARIKAKHHFTVPEMAWERSAPQRLAHLGIRPQRQEGKVMVGAVPVLGRVSPELLKDLADLAVRANGGMLRLTPWSSIILTDVAAPLGAQILDALRALGLAVDAAQPLAQMVACSGTVGCNSALADTKRDARILAGLLAAPRDVHLTACPKSCASARVAAFTLVALDSEHYDLYERQQPGQSDFGRKIASSVTIEQAARVLA